MNVYSAVITYRYARVCVRALSAARVQQLRECVCKNNERMSKKFMGDRKRQPHRHSQAANSRKRDSNRGRATVA